MDSSVKILYQGRQPQRFGDARLIVSDQEMAGQPSDRAFDLLELLLGEVDGAAGYTPT